MVKEEYVDYYKLKIGLYLFYFLNYMKLFIERFIIILNMVNMRFEIKEI